MNQKHFAYTCPFCGAVSYVTLPGKTGWGDARCEHANAVKEIDPLDEMNSKPIIAFAKTEYRCVDGTPVDWVPMPNPTSIDFETGAYL